MEWVILLLKELKSASTMSVIFLGCLCIYALYAFAPGAPFVSEMKFAMPWVMIAGCISFSATLVYGTIGFVEKRLALMKLRKERAEAFSRLTEMEKTLLRQALSAGDPLMYFNTYELAIEPLKYKSIIRQAMEYRDAKCKGEAYMVEPWAWQMVKAHPEIVD